MAHEEPAPLLSIVAPMRNERDCVDEFVRRVDAVLEILGYPAEIVAVADGPTDGTDKMLRTLAASYPRLRAVLLARNVGQAVAIDAGFQHSRGEYVLVMDADLQHPPEEIPKLLAKIRTENLTLVSGSRDSREGDPIARTLPSRIANALLRRVTGCEIRDMGGFKIIKGDVARSMRLRSGQHRLLPAIVHVMGGSTGEVFIPQHRRFAGASNYRSLGRSFDVTMDILLLWFQSSAKKRPIYLFGRIALGLLAVDAVIMPVLLWGKFVNGIDMGTRPPFLVAIMFFLSALFILAAGFILELLSDTLAASSGSRPYIVRDVVDAGSRRVNADR
jgi:glycosyltransferase involved in cell wall biosynthesis